MFVKLSFKFIYQLFIATDFYLLFWSQDIEAVLSLYSESLNLTVHNFFAIFYVQFSF